MRTLTALSTAFCLLLALGLALASVRAGLPSASAAPLRQEPEPSTCVADGQAWAFPRMLLLGETTTVTLNLRAVCAAEPRLTHIVLVLDGSQATAGATGDLMRQAANDLVDALDLHDWPMIKVAVVEFSSSARTLCSLSNVPGQVKGCISRARGEGAPCIDCGIREGLRALLEGRRRAQETDTILENLIIYSDGADAAGCPPVLTAARQAKAQGILVSAVCLTGNCQTECMRQVVSDADDLLYELDDAANIASLIRWSISRNATPIKIRRAVITETLSAGMRLVPGSAVPAADVSSSGDRLVWTTNFLPSDGMTVTYKVQPTRVGGQAISTGAVAVLRDSEDRELRVRYEIPRLTVLQPFPITPAPQRWQAFLPLANLPPRAGLP